MLQASREDCSVSRLRSFKLPAIADPQVSCRMTAAWLTVLYFPMQEAAYGMFAIGGIALSMPELADRAKKYPAVGRKSEGVGQ